MEKERFDITGSLSPEKLFLYIGFCFGLVFIFIIPPLQMPDEDSHIKKAYAVSCFKLLPEQNEVGQPGNYLPAALIDFEKAHRDMRGNISLKYSYGLFYSSGYQQSINTQDMVFCIYHLFESHPLLYFPQSIGMAFGRGLFFFRGYMSPLDLMIFGRLFNLMFFLVTGYMAIQLIPFMKYTLLLILTLPMTLSLAASLSYDVMTIGICSITIALLLRYAYKTEILKITKAHLAILCLCAIILFPCKHVYYPVFFLFMSIPSEKFNSIKQKFLFFFIILSSGILLYLLWILAVKINYAQVPESLFKVGLSQEQIGFVLQNPFRYLSIIVNTFSQMSGFYISSFIGILGSLDTNFPFAFIALMSLFLIITSIAEGESAKISGRDRVLFLGTAFFILLLIITALYVTWTPLPHIGMVGNPIVIGVQGRYFIPVAVLFLISIGLPAIKNNYIESIRGKIIGAVPPVAISALNLTIFIILFRFYLN